jgi:hypothetical protein
MPCINCCALKNSIKELEKDRKQRFKLIKTNKERKINNI